MFFAHPFQQVYYLRLNIQLISFIFLFLKLTLPYNQGPIITTITTPTMSTALFPKFYLN